MVLDSLKHLSVLFKPNLGFLLTSCSSGVESDASSGDPDPEPDPEPDPGDPGDDASSALFNPGVDIVAAWWSLFQTHGGVLLVNRCLFVP